MSHALPILFEDHFSQKECRKYCWWKKSQTTTWDGAKNLVNNGIFDKFTISTGELIPDFWLPSTYQLKTSTAPVKLHQVQDGIWTTKALQDGHQILEDSNQVGVSLGVFVASGSFLTWWICFPNWPIGLGLVFPTKKWWFLGMGGVKWGYVPPFEETPISKGCMVFAP